MRTIDKRLNAKLAPVLVKRAPTLTLPYDARCKSRFAATLDTGEEVGVVLPRGTVLRDGDMLVADDGGLVNVAGAIEKSCPEGEIFRYRQSRLQGINMSDIMGLLPDAQFGVAAFQSNASFGGVNETGDHA